MAEQPDIIMEVREEKMVSTKGGKPTKKIAHFIKPTLSSTDSTPEMPTTYLPPKPITLNCTINGWRYPTQSWVSWVDRLHSSYQYIWKRAGIYDAILSSKYKIVKNEDLFYGLAERWCCDTNTFVFPWGEATVTLEDVAVLGGYSVLGDSVSGFVDFDDFVETEKKLVQAHVEISRGSSQKAQQGTWMKYFMGLGGDTGIEHEAFLSFWLSRFVLPTFPFDVIAKRFFKIAICLARGVQIALAPVVLASIYRDLSLLKSGVVTVSDCCSTESKEGGKRDGFDDLVMLTLWGPLQLVQVWAWERFPVFRPKPVSIEYGEPRLARWHDVNKNDIGNVRPLLQSAGEGFVWRPYCKQVVNLPLPIFYRETEERVVVGDGLGDDMKAMVQFLRVCELVGMDTVEQYNPHRVAMQFGFDQDVPKVVKRDLMTSGIPKRELVQLAWLTYINPIRDENLYVPSKFYEPQVTLRYLKWLRQGVLARHATFDGFVGKRRSIKRPRGSQEHGHAVDLPPGFMSVPGGNEFDAPLGFPPMPDVPPGFPPKSNAPPCFSPKLDAPPGFPPKPDVSLGFSPYHDVLSRVADVPPGFAPRNHIGHVAQVIDVPPGFAPKTVGNNSASCFSPIYNESTTLCVEERNSYALASEVKVKKECVEYTERSKPFLWHSDQNLSAETGFKGERSLKIEAGELSGRSEHVVARLGQDREHVNGETQSLAHRSKGKSDKSSQRFSQSNLEAGIRQLEKMVADLSKHDKMKFSGPV